jgi:hypothetical protein
MRATVAALSLRVRCCRLRRIRCACCCRCACAVAGACCYRCAFAAAVASAPAASIASLDERNCRCFLLIPSAAAALRDALSLTRCDYNALRSVAAQFFFLSANLPCSYGVFDDCRAPQKILQGLYGLLASAL